MAYLKCFGMGALMALAGAFAWLIYMLVEASWSIPPEVRQSSVAIDIRSLFDTRSLLVVLGFFIVGFFVELLILKRELLHSR